MNVTVLSVVRWLRAVRRWLSEASMLWSALAGSVLVPVVTILIIGPTEQGLRVAGLLMQLLGLATVTWGIRQTWLIFKRPGLAEIARSWIERFPAIQPDIVVTAATESAGGSARSRGYVWGNPPENASSDQRLAVVAANLERLRSRVDETENALDTEIRERVGSVQDERAAREAEDQQIRTFFEGVTAGGLNLSLVGVVWLALGIVAASLPGEIADFLK